MWKIGFFPITGDPIHYGHLTSAMNALKEFGLTSIYIQVCGDSEYKPSKVDKRHRHQMAKLAIKEFEPFLQYTPIGYEKKFLGEDLFIEFAQKPPLQAVDKFYYLAGIENKEIVIESFSKNSDKLKNINYELGFLAKDERSSTLFRNHGRDDMVPKAVLLYCKEHHLYGY